MKYTARLPKTNVNVSPTSPVKEFFVLAGGLLGIVVALYLLLGLAVGLIVPYVSTDLEKKMSVLFVGAFDSNKEESKRAAYIQALTDDMQNRCARLPYEFKIHINRSPAVNALAMPGGHITVFSGLLDKVESENELAFVLAHEMGHYAHRDHLRGLGRGLVFMTLSALLFGADSGVSEMIARGLNLTELSFSRKQETRADEFALETLNCFYGHVSGATDFFEKIPKARDPGKYGHYFASHPENRRRISHLKDLARMRKMNLQHRKPLPDTLWPS